jgi:hypothetical protein
MLTYPIFVQQILKDLPDYTERSRYLEVLKNRLEALVAPKVIVALSSRSLGNVSNNCLGFVCVAFIPDT